MNVKFYIDKPKASSSAIMIYVTFSGYRVRLGTGIVIPPSAWNPNKQQVRVSHPLHVAFRERLRTIATAADQIFSDMKLGDGRTVSDDDKLRYQQRLGVFITTDTLPSSVSSPDPLTSGPIIDGFDGITSESDPTGQTYNSPSPAPNLILSESSLAITRPRHIVLGSNLTAIESSPADSDFFDHFETFYRTYTIRTRSGLITTRRPAPRTLKMYQTFITALEEYCRRKRIEPTFDSINAAFYTDFMGWLNRERGLLDSSAGNYIKVLKTFMSWALDEERALHSNVKYTKFYAPKSDENDGGIALSLSELREIYDAKMVGALGKARDIFLLQTFTALRYSDLEVLRKVNFDLTNGFVVSGVKKVDSGEDVIIPIIPPLQQLLKKYPTLEFDFKSNVKQNAHLKTIGRRLGLDAPVLIRKRQAGRRTETVVPKWKLLTTHVARRTFATISVGELGIPEPVVNCVTGHAQHGTMATRYFIATKENVKTTVCNAWKRF